MMTAIHKTINRLSAIALLLPMLVAAQQPYRAGTTSANFLEIGYGNRGAAMGDASVSVVRDVASVYWNPAGLGYMEKNELQVVHQPWLASVNSSFVGLGYVVPRIGTVGVGFVSTHFGEEEVTSMLMQEGTGEKFDGLDYAVSLCYGRKLAQWFSFGISGKYINSRIWHESASAVALDLGAIVNTSFLSWNKDQASGMSIGMSIANYGTRMQYTGIDLKRPLDESPSEAGNFEYVPARYETQSWELPLIFRIGVSAHALYTARHRLILSVDALHPNNNSEYLNVGGEYRLIWAGAGEFAVRAGYKGLQMVDSEYGLALGFGVTLNYIKNNALTIDYSYRRIGLLGNMHAYSLGILF
jgi:hypothetical protein